MKTETIKIEDLYVHPLNDFSPHNTGKEWELFKENLKKEGIIHDVVVIPDSKGKFGIVSGQRRYLAAKELGYKELNCKVDPKKRSKKGIRDFVLDLNLQNRHLNDLELTKYLMERYGGYVARQLKKGREVSDISKVVSAKSGIALKKVQSRLRSVANMRLSKEFRTTKGKKLQELLSAFAPAKRKRIETLILECIDTHAEVMKHYRKFRSAYSQLNAEIKPQIAGVSNIQANPGIADKKLLQLGVKNLNVGDWNY